MVVIGTALIVVVAGILISRSEVKKAAITLKLNDLEKIPALEEWDNPVKQNLWKEKLWIENQLVTGKEDSMNIGINFTDSIIQLQFKNLALVKSKINYKIPENFLSDINSEAYQYFFGKPVKILAGNSNIAKKPVKKVRIDSEGNTVPIDTTASINRRFYWEFITENNIRFVINGYNSKDSTGSKPAFHRDIRKYRFSRKAQLENKRVFTPVVFIWLDNDDAKAIYRALPYKATIISRN
ncbi:MAG: hypothetical protein JW833_10440 [Prolixibacteraceae bacterium]|nr:hypothetical protein [Prolixibacteraceae bacterium]